MTKQDKPAGMITLEKRNARFEQQVADSRDHDKQVREGTEKAGGAGEASKPDASSKKAEKGA